jgi:copper transport protein
MNFPGISSARARSKSVAGVLGVISILLLTPSSASAHAQLVSTYPEANSVLTSSPADIKLTWGEKVQTNSDQVILADSTGARVPTSYVLKFDATTNQSSVTLTPTNKLALGAYIVSWRAVSRDGHLVGGAYSFGVNQKPAKAKSTSFISYPDKVLQFIFWALLILAFGSILAGSYFLFVITAFLVIVIAGLRILVLSSLLPGSYLDSGSSKISLLAIITFALLLASSMKWVLSPDKIQREEKLNWLAISQLLVIALLFSSQEFFEGHALDLAHPVILRYIAAGHLFFAIAWAGSVCGLLFRPTRDQFDLTRKINTVSIFALIPLATTLTIFLAHPIKFYTKSYWALFIGVKILLVAITLALGAFHHFASKKAAIEDNFNFRRSLIIEMGTFAAILIATVTLVSFTPPKILSQERSAVATPTASLTQSAYEIPLTFDNGMKGQLSIPKLTLGTPSPVTITLNGPKIQSAKNMYIYFSNAALNLTDIQVTLNGSKNRYQSNLLLPAKGDWHLDVQILLDPFTQAQANLDIIIK